MPGQGGLAAYALTREEDFCNAYATTIAEL